MPPGRETPHPLWTISSSALSPAQERSSSRRNFLGISFYPLPLVLLLGTTRQSAAPSSWQAGRVVTHKHRFLSPLEIYTHISPGDPHGPVRRGVHSCSRALAPRRLTVPPSYLTPLHPTPSVPFPGRTRYLRAGGGGGGAGGGMRGCEERRDAGSGGMAAGAHLGGSGKRGAIPAHLRRRKPGRRGRRAASRGTAGTRPLPAPRGQRCGGTRALATAGSAGLAVQGRNEVF